MTSIYARDLDESKRNDAFMGKGFEEALKKAEAEGEDLVIGEFDDSAWKKAKEAKNASSYSKKVMQWRNSKGKWIDSAGYEIKDWDDLKYRGWEFVQTTDDCSVIMKKNGIFEEWRVKP
jgi:hypothetical protein